MIGIYLIAACHNKKITDLINLLDQINQNIKVILPFTSEQIIYFIFMDANMHFDGACNLSYLTNIIFIKIPDVGYVMHELLKFKYPIKYLKNYLIDKSISALMYININYIPTSQLNFEFVFEKITVINDNAYIFGGHTNNFMNLCHKMNKYIEYDMKCDANINKHNYQINKYIKEFSHTIHNIKINPIFYPIKFESYINYVTCHLTCGLGNILFQIIATISYSVRHNLKYIFSIFKTNNIRPSICTYRLFDNLLKTNNELKCNTIISEQNFFDPMVNDDTNCIKVMGYFQSILYFNDDFDKLLNFDDFDDVRNIHNDIKNQNEKNIISIHVRRTDYIGNKKYYNLTEQYYTYAINEFDENDTYVIFSDDIKWCKIQQCFVNLKNKIFIDNLNDEKSLYLMSLCDHNIIANSTFSLWGHYLNLNKSKKLIVPNIWYDNKELDISTITNCTNVITIKC